MEKLDQKAKSDLKPEMEELDQKAKSDKKVKKASDDKEYILDKNTFVLYNKQYPHAKLAQWGTGRRDFGTKETKTDPKQLWYFEESPTDRRYHYLTNVHYDEYRLSKWGSGQWDVGVESGHYHEYQLWIVAYSTTHHVLFNKEDTRAKLTKFEKADDKVGTYTGGQWPDQYWILVSRYDANAKEVELWNIDNR